MLEALLPAFIGPPWTAHLQPCTSRRPRVLVKSQIKAGGLKRINFGHGLAHLPPVGLTQRLVMGNLQANTACSHNLFHFVNRFQQLSLLAAHMHHHDTVILRNNSGHFNKLPGIGIAPRRVDKAQGQSLRALLHALGQQ